MQERQGTNPFAVASVELGLVVLGLLLSFIAYSNHNNLSCANTSSWTTWLILILVPTTLLAMGLFIWLEATALRLRRILWIVIGAGALVAAVALATPIGGAATGAILVPAFGTACGPYAQYLAYFTALAALGIVCWTKALREAA